MDKTDLLWSRPDTHPILLQELEYRGWTPRLTTDSFVEVPHLLGLSPWWVRSYWPQVERTSFQSVSEAAGALRDVGGLWTPFYHEEKSRTKLIAEALRCPLAKPMEFGKMPPNGQLGGFALLDRNTLVFSKNISPNIRGEQIEFVEDEKAPSRAYQKLWEIFTRLRVLPSRGEKVTDFGSSPGGWTYVLARLGCEVWSFDKAKLDDSLKGLSNIHYASKDIYKIKMEDLPELDWFFSDVIAYPLDLFEFLLPWIEAKKARNFVITLKFKGDTDFKAIEKWLSIPGSRVLHLGANKHELTWFLQS